MGTSGKSFNQTWLPALGEAASEAQFHARFLEPFTSWANTVIPEDAYVALFDFNDHGYPIFPTRINVLHSTGEELQGVMETYLNLVYGVLSFT